MTAGKRKLRTVPHNLAKIRRRELLRRALRQLRQGKPELAQDIHNTETEMKRNLDALVMAVEKVTGLTIDEFLRQH